MVPMVQFPEKSVKTTLVCSQVMLLFPQARLWILQRSFMAFAYMIDSQDMSVAPRNTDHPLQ